MYNRTIGIVGSATLFLGTLCPAIGDKSFIINGNIFGFTLLLIALIATFFSIANNLKAIRILAILSSSLILIGFFYMQYQLYWMYQNPNMVSTHAGLLEILMDIAVEQIERYLTQTGWGWIPVSLGSILLLISGFSSSNQRPNLKQ